MGTVTTTTRADWTLTTLEKGLRILELLASDEAAGGLTLTELSRRLAMHRTTLFRFLTTLRDRGYVERDHAGDRYLLGMRVLHLSAGLLSRLDIRHIARPVLLALRDETQELVHLAVLDGPDVITVERVAGTHAVSLQTDIGERRPAYCTASGKAMLAFLPDAEVDGVLERGTPRITARTITTSEAMRRHLSLVREAGYAVDDEERVAGVRCVAAPIFDLDGRVAGAVSIAAPTTRMPRQRTAACGTGVRSAAAAISRQLGYSQSRGPRIRPEPRAPEGAKR